ncbi:hypothetical protein [Oceanithermus sp.]|uniref:hypothetical protein n=1 Tax=Oceanithermus sp. TaxID=2268145 RepID=UPI00257F287E|nr:hypothetical protein [Oceanithermus sp.]
MTEPRVRATPRWRWRANALAEALARAWWVRLPTTPHNVGLSPSSDRARLSGGDPGPQVLDVVVPAVEALGWPEERYRVGWHAYRSALAALTEAERGELASWLKRSDGGAVWRLRNRFGRTYVEPASHWGDNDPLLSGLLVLAGELLR